MKEHEIRKALREADELRERAEACRNLTRARPKPSETRLAIETKQTIRRRFRSGRAVVSEVELSDEERDMLESWLLARCVELTEEADRIVASLTGADEQGDGA